MKLRFHILSFLLFNCINSIATETTLNTLALALKTTGLLATLNDGGTFKVFAPTDEAFSKIPKKILDYLLKNSVELTDILFTHVATGTFYENDLANIRNLKLLNGKFLDIINTFFV